MPRLFNDFSNLNRFLDPLSPLLASAGSRTKYFTANKLFPSLQEKINVRSFFRHRPLRSGLKQAVRRLTIVRRDHCGTVRADGRARRPRGVGNGRSRFPACRAADSPSSTARAGARQPGRGAGETGGGRRRNVGGGKTGGKRTGERVPRPGGGGQDRRRMTGVSGPGGTPPQFFRKRRFRTCCGDFWTEGQGLSAGWGQDGSRRTEDGWTDPGLMPGRAGRGSVPASPLRDVRRFITPREAPCQGTGLPDARRTARFGPPRPEFGAGAPHPQAGYPKPRISGNARSRPSQVTRTALSPAERRPAAARAPLRARCPGRARADTPSPDPGNESGGLCRRSAPETDSVPKPRPGETPEPGPNGTVPQPASGPPGKRARFPHARPAPGARGGKRAPRTAGLRRAR
jgi:hypothetical protein